MAEEKILDRVAKLLAIAEHPNTGEHEREVALAQAQSLMTKHAIDEAMLLQSQTTEQRRRPSKHNITMAAKDYSYSSSSYLPQMRTVLSWIARVNRCSVAYPDYFTADIYGAEEDIRWVEMLFMHCYVQMLSNVNPKWDPSKGYDENVYNLKVAGEKWVEINREAVKHGQPDARPWARKYINPEHLSSYWTGMIERGEAKLDPDNEYSILYRNDDGKLTGRLIAAYKRHAKLIGDEKLVATANHRVYKMSYVEGFKDRMVQRLQQWQEQNQTQMDTIPGAALAIVDWTDEVKQMMYADHPHLDPEEQKRRIAEARRERAAMLDAMSPEERAKFLEKEERESRRAAKRIRYYTPDDAGSSRGAAVADRVDLTRKAGYAHAGGANPELT